MSEEPVVEAIARLGLDPTLHEQSLRMSAALPIGTHYTDDVWNVVSWDKVRGRARERNLNFSKVINVELREAAKLYVLLYRVMKGQAGGTALGFIGVIKALDAVVPADLPLRQLNNDHFLKAQARLLEVCEVGSQTPSNYAGRLSQFGRFLNQYGDIRISFKRGIQLPAIAGQQGPEEGRLEKLIPLGVLRDLLAVVKTDNLHLKDEFYLHMLMILVSTGFRTGELVTLPADCILDENDNVGIRYFNSKVGRFDRKPVASAFAPAVRNAVKRLQEITAPGRAAALRAWDDDRRGVKTFDWSYIFRTDRAVQYFVGRLLHAWTANPNNNILNPAGAWFERDKRYIDIIGMLAETSNSYSVVARRLGTTVKVIIYLKNNQEAALRGELPLSSVTGQPRVKHYTDSRFVTLSAIQAATGWLIKDIRLAKVSPLLKEAQRLQLLGLVYPEPPFDQELEEKFRVQHRAVIYDAAGRGVVEPHQALFVVEPHTLSYGKLATIGKYVVVPDNTFIRWLGGEAGAKGSGRVVESVFVRFGIFDPRTNQIAKFTPYQIRHWLNTMYLKGGLSSIEAALIMGHDSTINQVYDQRSDEDREADFRQVIRERRGFGHIADVYISMLKETPQEAEKYILASLRRYTLMPHGACVRDLQKDPCPNHLACFVDQERDDEVPCQHLLIDVGCSDTIAHLKMLEGQQDTMLQILQPSTRQHSHALRTKLNIKNIIERV